MRKKRKYVAKNAEMCYPLKVGGDIFMPVEYRVKLPYLEQMQAGKQTLSNRYRFLEVCLVILQI